MTKALSTEIMGFVGCSDCGKFLRTKLFNGNVKAHQTMIRIEGVIISHGLCPECAAKILEELQQLKQAA